MGGCTDLNAPGFSPRDLQQVETSHAGEVSQRPLYPLHQQPQPVTLPSTRAARQDTAAAYRTPTTLPYPTAQSTGPAVRLSLQQCIHLAAANSLTVRVAGYQPGIDEARVREAMAKFDPTFFEQFQFQHTDVIQPSVEDPTLSNPLGFPIRFSSITSTTGIKQDTEWGAEVQLSYLFGYNDRILPVSLATPGLSNNFYNSELTFKITQPLLQNFGREANYARVEIAKNTQISSLLDFRLALEKQMSDIEEAYWQLVQAEQDVRIREELLESAKGTESLTHGRLGTDATDIDVAQADAAVSQRAQELPTARATVEKLSNKLKRLINDPAMPVATGPLLLPSDAPSEEPIQFDSDEAIATALDYRAELAQQETKIETARITQQAAKNNELPTLNLVASFGVEGDAGPELRGTLSNLFRTQDGNLLDYSVGIELDVPLGFQEAKAIYRRTLLTRLQAIDQYHNLAEQITQEVRDALADVHAAWKEIDAARQTRLKVQKELNLLEDRIQNKGLALSPPVTQQRLQTQIDFGTAQRAEMEAITNYNIALSKLELAKGTLLKYNNITMQEETPGSTSPRERDRH
jgi:outer membrane protein TolC